MWKEEGERERERENGARKASTLLAKEGGIKPGRSMGEG